MTSSIQIEGLRKSFRLHNQGSVELKVLDGVDLSAKPGECVVLAGPSGTGKSTLLRCAYGNYLADGGHIRVRGNDRETEIVGAHHRTILDLRRRTIGYVSQFLRVVPRVPTIDVVAEPLLRIGLDIDIARTRAGELLEQLAVPQRLWNLAPQTFSGGEQQRVNIARGFAVEYPVMLLDEPTAALDEANRRRVAGLIERAKARGAAILGVFHDLDLAEIVGTRIFRMTPATAPT